MPDNQNGGREEAPIRWLRVPRTTLRTTLRAYDGRGTSAYESDIYTSALVAHADALVTVTTIDRLVVVWIERYLIFGATFGADDGMHLARRSLTLASHTALLAACGTASRLVEQSFQLVELLLSSGENKRLATLTTL